MPPIPYLSFTGLDEFANKPVTESNKSSEEETMAVRKNDNFLIIEEWVSNNEEENEECKALKNQDNKHKESSRRSVPVETTNSTTLVSCDGLGGYDWSLESVEERLKFFKTNESIYLEDIKVLKVEIQLKEIAIIELRKKLEIAQKEKDGIQLTVDKFENASKGLNKLIECQIGYNYKKGLGYENYNAVPPHYTGKLMPPIPYLSFTSLDEFANKPVTESNKSSEEETMAVRKNDNSLIIEEWVSNNEEENES
nr:hypothetical protein [Tanacetum cinerariifolium]